MKFKARLFKRFEFSQKFLRFLFVDRTMINKDNLALLTGKRGDGKTTLALKILLGFKDGKKFKIRLKDFEKYYNEEVNKGVKKKKKYSLKEILPFNMKKHMAFTREAMQDLCKELRNGFILGDEAIVNVARKNTMTKANKILHEILTINRKNKNTVVLCLPSIEDFDLSMLQYVTHWIHVDDRGLAAVLMPEAKSIFGRKTWDIDRMKKIYDKFLEDNPTVTSVPYWLFDNFRGYIRFKKLRKKTEDEYLKIAHKEKNKDSTESEGRTKSKDSKISPEKMEILKTIAEKIINGDIKDNADYYAYCASLEFNKSKLNREVNELLAQMGDGRTAARAIRDNMEKDLASYEQQMKEKKVIY